MIATETIDRILKCLATVSDDLGMLYQYLDEHESEATADAWGEELLTARMAVLRVHQECCEMADAREKVTP